MATIALYASKLNQMAGLINDFKQTVSDYKSELFSLKTKTLTVNRSVCNLDDVISSIQSSSQTQEQKIASIEAFSQNSEQFISDAVSTDNNVADVINKSKDDFYDKYYYLKPDCEKNGWEKAGDWLVSAGEWCKEHWKLIVVIVLVIIAIVVIVCTFGTALGPFMLIVVGACKGLIMGALVGGLMGGATSWLSGGSFWEGFENGAFTGALTGALFGGLGAAGQLFGQAFGSSCQIFKVMGYVSKISGAFSLGMAGFDLISFGAGLIWGDNPLTAFNQKLHSSKLYNAFQFTVSAIAVFSTSAYNTMKPMSKVCFVAGTMILTASGLVAIENIKVGDKVISTDADTGANSEKSVIRTFVNESTDLAHIYVNGEKITATPGHLFYVIDKGWIPAGSLSQGSVLVLPEENRTEVKHVELEILKEPVRVYNFEVADWHTYHVGNAGVLVHNDCVQNKSDGVRREADMEAELSKKYPESEGYQIKREALLRDSSGKKVIDPETGTGRRIDFVVERKGKIVDSIEVTSQTATKDLQIAHEVNVRANGGNYVRLKNGSLVQIAEDLITRIVRRD